MTSSGASISEYAKSPGNVAGFRKLRASILASLGRSEPKSILILPVSERDDAAAVAVGVATSLAAPGYDVVLIDAQFTCPSAHEAFAKDQGPGLAEALTGGASSKPPALQSVMPGLGLLAAGANESLSADLLASLAFERLLGKLKQAGKWVVAVGDNPASDGGAAPVAPLVDATILVAAHGKSKTADAVNVRGSLNDAGATVLGIVMTGDG